MNTLRKLSTLGRVLTARDHACLTLLYQFGCLSSEHLTLLCYRGVAKETARRRLVALTQAGLVRRARLPEAFAPLPSRHYIYTLTERGADQLPGGVRVRPFALGTLLHDLGSNHLIIELARREGGQLLPEPMLRRLVATAAKAHLVPPGFCIPDGAVVVKHGAVLLEFVRTSPRSGLASVRQKFARYAEHVKRGAMHRVYGLERVRAVLVVSTLPGRTDHLRAAAASLHRGRNLFVFGTTNAQLALPTSWRRAAGEPGKLAELLASP